MTTLTAIKPLLAFQVERSILLGVLEKAVKLLPEKSLYPILNNLKLEVSRNTLSVTVTDLVTEAIFNLAVSDGVDGAFLVPGKMFFEMVKNLPAGAITITVDEETSTLNLKGKGKGKYNLRGINAEEYPSIHTVSFSKNITVSPTWFDGIAPVLYSVSSDEIRGVLTGVNVVINPIESRFISATGHTMARCINDPLPVEDEIEFILPLEITKTLLNFVGLDDVTIHVNDDLTIVKFVTVDWTLTSRLYDGKYPKVDELLKTLSTFSASFDINRKALIQTIQAMLVTSGESTVKDKKFKVVNLKTTDEGLELYSTSQDGNSSDTLEIENLVGTIDLFKINGIYALDALKAITDEKVSLNICGGGSQIIINNESKNQTHLIAGISTR